MAVSTKLEEKDFKISLKKSLGRSLARFLSKRCEECGKERFFSAIDYYSSKKNDCIQCQVTSYLMWPIIRIFFKRFLISKEVTKQILDDQLLRRTMMNLIKGVAHFGVKIPQPTRVPVVIVWNITNRCNLNCLHCHQSSTLNPSEKELTTPEALQIIDKLSDAGLSILTFSGGEPLIQPDFLLAFLKVSKKKNIHTVLDTSGYAPWRVFKRAMGHVDLFLYDLKIMDNENHRKYT